MGKQYMEGDVDATIAGPVVMWEDTSDVLRAVSAAKPLPVSVTGATKDDGPSWTQLIGIAGARFTSADASGAAAAVITAPGAGLKAVITDIVVSVGSALTVTITEETAGTVLFTLYMAANTTIQITPRGELKLSTAVKRLMVQTSGAGNIAVTTFYYTEA